MPSKKKSLLLTNDDGIDAPGLQTLRAALARDYNVMVSAPKFEKSGAGCSLSLSNEMEVTERAEKGKVWGYAVDGTPADCVKFALTKIEGFRPDFVLSGINRGMNVGNSVFYSGTVAAALEASLFGFPAMACSLACHGASVFEFDAAATVVTRLLPWMLEREHQPRTLWNLNMPNVPLEKMGAVRLAAHGTSFYVDQFELYRQEGAQQFYKNVGTRLEACALGEDADDRIVKAGGISLTLLNTCLTVPIPKSARQSIEAEWNGLVKAKG